MEVQRLRGPGSAELKRRGRATAAIAACADCAGAGLRHLDGNVEPRTQRDVGQYCTARCAGLVEVNTETDRDFPLVPEHLDRWAVIVFDMQLGNHHFLRKIHLLQLHGLVVAVPGGAVQGPVSGLLPLAAGAVGAFAGGTLGGGGHADGAIAQAGDYLGQGRQRLGAGQLQGYRVGGGFRDGGGDDEVVDVYSHGLSP
ncbi:hypothetical protein D9M71_351770 [compost metagenome]